MKKYMMTNEEFCKCNSIEDKELFEINKELESKGISDTSERLEYVKQNYGGHIYLYFVLKELDDKILMNYHDVPENYLFSLGSVDGVLRAFLFATKYMQAGLPEHAFNYIKSNSSTFISELEKQLREV